MTEHRLFHIIASAEWAAAETVGQLVPGSLAREGFVHFSYAHQVAAVANRLYRDVLDPIVVEFDPSRIASPVVVEDSYGTGEAFPHIYLAIPVAAALDTYPLSRDDKGNYEFNVASPKTL